uniref:Uncharacterized protein n=1 Tax=Romanomermis culicivorax TaxID=13658 RepID=A0A915I7L3_ROMCU
METILDLNREDVIFFDNVIETRVNVVQKMDNLQGRTFAAQRLNSILLKHIHRRMYQSIVQNHFAGTVVDVVDDAGLFDHQTDEIH